MKTIQIVTKDADLAARVRDALRYEDFNIRVSDDFPMDGQISDFVDLLILDCVFDDIWDVLLFLFPS